MKLCSFCKAYPVFGGGMCRLHQGYRLDKKPYQPKRKRINPISAKNIIRKQGVTEMNIFLEIWAERPHVSELSGTPLQYDIKDIAMWVKQFLHVLNKGRFPSLRLEKRNIMLGLPEEHDRQDTFEKFTQRKEELLSEIYNQSI